jgi:hypothetical protein
MQSDEARTALLAAARQLLDLSDEAAQVTVIVTQGQAVVVSGGQPAATQPAPEGLPPLQRDILAVLTAQPVPARRLARLASRQYNSNFRNALAAIVEAGLARHTRKGYFRP